VASVNINPSLAWKLSDELSIGAGLSVQYLDATLSNAVDSGAVCLGTAPNNAARAECVKAGLTAANLEKDSFAEVSGDSWAFNFNLGLLYKFNPRTRVGLAFRSEINHELEGEADFDVDPTLQQFLTAAGSTAFTDTDVTADANLPASLSFSVSHDLDDKIQLLADITWTQWSSFEELRVKFDNPAQPDSFTTENWDDVMRYSIGVNYQHSETWTFRGGLAFDEEPIPSAEYRTPRIPGNDRTWLSFGVGYRLNSEVSMDFGYSHLFVDETPINHTDESIGHTTRGLYDSSINIFSAQLNWHFD
ncbi:MAG: outer membrane protein transport protein, partial [Gammaproteobacteria bacterium]|nr:outer membrane protein transport protein [Gammaproteobacteria bacterium]